MSPLITYALLIALGLYGLIVLLELIVSHGVKRFVMQAAVIVAVVILLNLTMGFPETRQSFGGVSAVVAIAIMFLCTVLGIAGHYFFYRRGKFSWTSFLKPMVISPIVLLPLMGSVPGASDVQAIQLISFGFLAFQNGFFWREVVARAKSQI